MQDVPIDQKIKLELEQLLERNQDCFAEDERQIGTTPLTTMSIDTGDHFPVAKRPYTLALKHHDWVKAEIDKLLEAGFIRESDSSWSAPIVVVPKGDGGKRLCIDYRALNIITKTYSQKDIDQLLEQSRVENITDRKNFETHIRN